MVTSVLHLARGGESDSGCYSLLHWLVLPRIHQIHGTLGSAVVELQDLQNVTICQHLQDHIIEFGLLRSDLVARGSLAGKALGEFGYSLFIPHALLPNDAKASEAGLIQKLPLAVQGGNTLFQHRLEEIAASGQTLKYLGLLAGTLQR